MKRSTTFAHGKDIKKIVDEDRVLAYLVYGGGFSRSGSATVQRLYAADYYIKSKDKKGKPVTTILSGFERGERIHGWFHDDPVGSILAMIAGLAIMALEDRQAIAKNKESNGQDGDRKKSRRRGAVRKR